MGKCRAARPQIVRQIHAQGGSLFLLHSQCNSRQAVSTLRLHVLLLRRFDAVLPDFNYLKDPATAERAIEASPALVALDDEFREVGSATLKLCPPHPCILAHDGTKSRTTIIDMLVHLFKGIWSVTAR